jgi:hypothetical protein
MSDEWLKPWWVGADRPYLEVIGQIVVCAAQADAMLCSLFWHYAGLDPTIGRCITGELNGRTMARMLRKMVRARGLPPAQIADVEAILDETNSLAQQRDKVAHWEWGVGHAGEAIMSKRLTAKSVGQISHEKPSLEELRQLADRYAALYPRICAHLMPREVLAAMPQEIRDAFFPFPWLDRPG